MMENFNKNINTLKNYYMELIDVLMAREQEDSIAYLNLKLKRNTYPDMFKYAVKDKNNLLYYYLSSKSMKDIEQAQNNQNSEMLLIEQANESQKRAILNALSRRASIIQGPPGTGKTTTILNIISNLIYEGKKVLVVSKNNSAIDNVVEELDKMSIPRGYIRMGSTKVLTEKLEPIIEQKLIDLKSKLSVQNDELRATSTQNLIQIARELNEKESKLDKLIYKRNELQELKNQLKHVNKKSEAFDLDQYEIKIKKKYKKMTPTRLKNTISYLAKTLIILDEKDKLGIFNKIASYILLKMNESILKEDGIAIHMLLEKYYLTNLIDEIELELKKENFEKLKNEIHEIYEKKYIPASRNVFAQKIKNMVNKNRLNQCIDKVKQVKYLGNNETSQMPMVDACKNDLIKVYPIVLTTADSLVSNYKSYFQDEKLKVDYIIIDEASQCDILSGLPVLFLAKNVIVVGDEKQLSAITSIEKDALDIKVDENHDYGAQNFLESVINTINPVSTMLLEHYRCDYAIINYCNKFFYENKLKIYNDAKPGAMSIIDCDKGKYVESIGGYKNEREIKTISEYIGNNISEKFIITPYKKQAERLKKCYDEERCGTIHTFQGKGEKQVYFSAVLNGTEQCKKHLNGKNNLFTKELINVAVSRAKEKFVLVIDRAFFKNNDKNMRNLIEYIETYGDVIPDKTVCIFDYLYKKISSYQKIVNNIDNPFEERVYEFLLKYVENNNKALKVAAKLPLAELISDKKFLDENKDLKKFVLCNSHIDFSIYSESINKPLLAIEVDGKTHQYQEQKIRDEKKEKVLAHMNIPLLRISSKITWDEKELENHIIELIEK